MAIVLGTRSMLQKSVSDKLCTVSTQSLHGENCNVVCCVLFCVPLERSSRCSRILERTVCAGSLVSLMPVPCRFARTRLLPRTVLADSRIEARVGVAVLVAAALFHFSRLFHSLARLSFACIRDCVEIGLPHRRVLPSRNGTTVVF